jgi:hypothetical protein
MDKLSIDGLIRDLMALNRVARSGSPSRLRVTWKKSPTARTLAGIAQRTDRNHQRHQAPPVRRVANILEQLITRAEGK